MSWSTAAGQVDSGHGASCSVEDGLEDVHLEGVHDARHVVGLLEVEDRCVGGQLVTNPSLASAQH